MKLLFDENLSPKLPRLVAASFPGSQHIRELGLKGQTDEKIGIIIILDTRYRVETFDFVSGGIKPAHRAWFFGCFRKLGNYSVLIEEGAFESPGLQDALSALQVPYCSTRFA